MEVITTKLFEGANSYWRESGYRRLGTPTTHDGLGQEESGRWPQRRRRLRRIRVSRRLKLKLTRYPRKLFFGIRDAYVKIMMKLANTSMVRGRTVTGCNGDGFGNTAIKESCDDEKIIIEIFKNLSLKKHHHHHQISSHIVCSC